MCWHCMDLNINPNSPMKTHLVHVDVGDKYGQLTIIVDINNHLIPRFLEQFPWIQCQNHRFWIEKKVPHHRGVAKSRVEVIQQVHKYQILSTYSTIKELVASNKLFLVGPIATIVIGCHKIILNMSYIPKTGTVYDHAILCLFSIPSILCVFVLLPIRSAFFSTQH